MQGIIFVMSLHESDFQLRLQKIITLYSNFGTGIARRKGDTVILVRAFQKGEGRNKKKIGWPKRHDKYKPSAASVFSSHIFPLHSNISFPSALEHQKKFSPRPPSSGMYTNYTFDPFLSLVCAMNVPKGNTKASWDIPKWNILQLQEFHIFLSEKWDVCHFKLGHVVFSTSESAPLPQNSAFHWHYIFPLKASSRFKNICILFVDKLRDMAGDRVHQWVHLSIDGQCIDIVIFDTCVLAAAIFILPAESHSSS